MTVFVCVDDRGGMLFNRRRVSRDRAQQEDMLKLCGAGKLWISPFSKALMEWAEERVIVDPEYLKKAGDGEVCFVEEERLGAFADRMEGVVLYRWNRSYPSDQKMDLDLSGFQLVERVEFAGTSHETITRETYRKKE